MSDHLEHLLSYRRSILARIRRFENLQAALSQVEELIAFEKSEREVADPKTSKERPPSKNGSAYPHEGTMANKILYAIRSLDRFVLRAEIESFIKKHDNVNSNTLSYTLSNLYRKGAIPRVRYGANQWTAYGLPHMLRKEFGGGVGFADPRYRPNYEHPVFEGVDRSAETFEMEKEMI